MSKKSLKNNGRLHENARKFKISIIGDMGTGKTCLSMRFVNNMFTETYKATISDIETKGIDIQGSYVVFQIWDTAGQERFRSLLPLYMKGIDGAIVVYDITDKVTYDNVNQWVTEVRKYAEDSTVIMVVGNKMDLAEDDGRKQVSTKDAKSWCTFHDILFHEASAKTGKNVDELFWALGEAMLLKTREQPCQYLYRDSSCTVSDYRETNKKCC